MVINVLHCVVSKLLIKLFYYIVYRLGNFSSEEWPLAIYLYCYIQLRGVGETLTRFALQKKLITAAIPSKPEM